MSNKKEKKKMKTMKPSKKNFREKARKDKKIAKEIKPRNEEPKAKMVSGKKIISLLRGMKDVLPRDEIYWKKIYHVSEQIADAYGYGRIDTPVMEEANLFIRSIGKATDVVEKEMYLFEDKDGSRVALRPEATASIARSFIEHGMQNQPQPVKVWYWGPMFRHDRPQAGRYRQFYQFGCETIGVHEPAVDAELIAAAYFMLLDLGLNCQVHINSIGTKEDRERYIMELLSYLRSRKGGLCEECRKRMVKNPLRVLDCKEEGCKKIMEEAPQIVDWLSDESRKFFMGVLEYLDELSIPYLLNSRIVRGLDYYSDTVFELYLENKETGSQSALGGGGRYNGLIEQLGGQPTPASGFALGVERIISALRGVEEQTGEKVKLEQPKIFLAQLGDQARRRALKIIEALRKENILVRHNLGKASLKAQLELANKLATTHTLIIGQKEVQDNTIIIRDMDSGIQEIVDQNKIESEVKKILLRLGVDIRPRKY